MKDDEQASKALVIIIAGIVASELIHEIKKSGIIEQLKSK